jgi:hypothetical protein
MPVIALAVNAADFRYSSPMGRHPTATACDSCAGSGTVLDLTLQPPEEIPCPDCGGKGFLTTA